MPVSCSKADVTFAGSAGWEHEASGSSGARNSTGNAERQPPPISNEPPIQVYNGTLVGAIRQMQSLLVKAHEIYDLIHKDLAQISSKTGSLKQRLQKVASVCDTLSNTQITPRLPTMTRYTNVKSHYSVTYTADGQLFLPDSRCTTFETLYQSCGNIQDQVPCYSLDGSFDANFQQQKHSEDKVLCENRECQTTESLKRQKRQKCLSWLAETEGNYGENKTASSSQSTTQSAAFCPIPELSRNGSGNSRKKVETVNQAMFANGNTAWPSPPEIAPSAVQPSPTKITGKRKQRLWRRKTITGLESKPIIDKAKSVCNGEKPVDDLSTKFWPDKESNIVGPISHLGQFLSLRRPKKLNGSSKSTAHGSEDNHQSAKNTVQKPAGVQDSDDSVSAPSLPIPPPFKRATFSANGTAGKLIRQASITTNSTSLESPASSEDFVNGLSVTRPHENKSNGFKKFLMRSMSLRLPKRSSAKEIVNDYGTYLPNLANANVGHHLNRGGKGQCVNTLNTRGAHFNAPIAKSSQVIQVAVRLRNKNGSDSPDQSPSHTLPVRKEVDSTKKTYSSNTMPLSKSRSATEGIVASLTAGANRQRPASSQSIGSNVSLDFVKTGNGSHYREGYRLEYPDECIRPPPPAQISVKHLHTNKPLTTNTPTSSFPFASPELNGHYFSFVDETDDYSIENSSAFSCDHEGYFTSMHKDSGLTLQPILPCPKMPGGELLRVGQSSYNAGDSSGNLSACSSSTASTSNSRLQQHSPTAPPGDPTTTTTAADLDYYTSCSPLYDTVPLPMPLYSKLLDTRYNQSEAMNHRVSCLPLPKIFVKPGKNPKLVNIGSIPEEVDDWILQKFQQEVQEKQSAEPQQLRAETFQNKSMEQAMPSFDLSSNSDIRNCSKYSSFNRKTVRFCE